MSRARYIAMRVLMRPTYDNADAHSFPQWFEANRRALLRFWWECNAALRLAGGPPPPDGDAEDFDLFCRCQHDREAREAMP